MFLGVFRQRFVSRCLIANWPITVFQVLLGRINSLYCTKIAASLLKLNLHAFAFHALCFRFSLEIGTAGRITFLPQYNDRYILDSTQNRRWRLVGDFDCSIHILMFHFSLDRSCKTRSWVLDSSLFRIHLRLELAHF